MLTAQAINCIRESVQAELRPRSTNLAAQLLMCDSEFGRAAAFNSSMRIQQRGLIACQELTVRAEIIWVLIQQCRRWFGEPDDSLVADLGQQIRDHITAQATAVVEQSGPTREPARDARFVEQPVMECRDQLIRKFSNKGRLFVEDLKQPPTASAAGGITILGPVGAVQTGAYATAQVHIDAAGGARLTEALEQLRAALPKAADMELDRREQGTELVGDLLTAARADKPNLPKLIGLLLALGTIVQTVASVRPAWDAVRLAANAIGIQLP